MKDEATRTTL